MTRRVARRLAALVLASSTCAAVAQTSPSRPPPVATAEARDAALRALAGRLTLPLLDEAVGIFSTQLRRTLPALFLDNVGEQFGLGTQWRRGNPAYDDAIRRIDAALVAEETRGGPLLRLERTDLLYAVDVPWTRDDIAFVAATLPTDLGHEAERALDAQAARQTIATLKRRIAVGGAGAGIAPAFADLDARAQTQFGDASLMLLALKGTDPPRAQRLQRLVEAVRVAPSDAIGQRVVDRLSQRLIDAATRQLPDIVGTVVGGQLGR